MELTTATTLTKEVPVHRNARLTPAGRLLLCQRIEGGWPVAHAAAAMGISRDRAYVWWHRYQEEGLPGLEDRSSRPQRCPNRTKASAERRILTLNRRYACPEDEIWLSQGRSRWNIR